MVEIGFNNDPVYIYRDRGDAPAWFRVLFYGPLTHPTVTIGNVQIELGIDVQPNVIVEVSSYPWMRRVVDSNNINWRAALIGSSQYLDQLQIPAQTEIACRWTDESLTTWTALPGSIVNENPDFLDMFAITSGWHTLMGTPIWGFSLKTGGYLFGPFGITAILDINHSYTTPSQFVEAGIGDIWRGLSAIVFKSNDDMTNFAGILVFKSEGLGEDLGIPSTTDSISIITGTQYNLQTIHTTYIVPSPGLHTGDRVGVVYNNTDRHYQMYLNGNAIGTPWVDSGNLINDANMRQGFVMNCNDSITNIQFGVGFNNIVAYDASFNPTGPPDDPGDLSSRCFLYWRDTWSIE
jgi:hypothetical protein